MRTFITLVSLTAATILASIGKPAVAGTLNIDSIIYDMSQPSEALVINPAFDFQRRPTVTQYAPKGTILPSWWTGNRPEWCYRLLSWYTAFEAEGNGATNTRVQVRNLRIYILSNATRKWTLVDSKAAPPGDVWKYPFTYYESFSNSDTRTETSGGYSVKPAYPYFFHGYGTTYEIQDPADIRAVYVAMDFRLVVDNPRKPNDTSLAKYVIDVGADYYPGQDQTWGVGYAPGVGNGRYLLATNKWRTATLLVPNKLLGSTYDEMRITPPPMTTSY
jgi:hypothetical protein